MKEYYKFDWRVYGSFQPITHLRKKAHGVSLICNLFLI